METRPHTAPQAKPKMEGEFLCMDSRKIQVTPPVAAAIFVETQATPARPLAPKAEPPLNPNHPNQRMAVPRRMKDTDEALFSYYFLFPNTRVAARAENPEAIWTTLPPAKSKIPHF
jgi:hypothetical protein